MAAPSQRYGAQPRAAARRGSLPVTSTNSAAAMAPWKIPRHAAHAQDDLALKMATYGFHAPPPSTNHARPPAAPPAAASPFQQSPEASTDRADEMKYIHRHGQQHGAYPLKIAAPTKGVDLRQHAAAASMAKQQRSPHAVQLPEGTLHVWVYQARHLVFRRLFETMYERHGLRLRVYAGSRTTQDVGEIYETRRNYSGNMANPRWRRDQDDARDNAHGHFSIPLARKSLRSETELIVEIVCGILVVAHTKISVPALFLGSFGASLESLATCNMQFRPHWFPLAGDDAGLIEMALEFIPTRIVREQQEQQRKHSVQFQQQQAIPLPPPLRASSNQPESEYDDYEEDRDLYAPEGGYEQQQQQQYLFQQQQRQYLEDQRRRSSVSPEDREKELDRLRAKEYEAMERHEQLRRQRFELLDDPHETRLQERARSATTASSSSSSSARSTRFVLPRRSSLSDLGNHQDAVYNQLAQYEVEGDYEEEEEVVMMDAYESSPPPSEFSGYELHDSHYDEVPNNANGFEQNVQEGRPSTDSDYYDDLSLSASSSWASVSTLNDSSQENLLNKQLWDLYRYGISDEAPEEINASSGNAADSIADSASLRASSASFSSMSSSLMSRSLSQASNFSVAFSDASEASMLSREASTCASEILTYNDRIQRMEEAIRSARERRLAEEAAMAQSAAITSQAQAQAAEARRHAQIPAPISTIAPAKPAPSLTPYGWERPQPSPLASPAASEPIILDNRRGVVLFDMDHIPVKGRSGQTDPALEAYRAKMLARRRSLPIHMLSGGAGGGLGFAPGPGFGVPHGGRRGPFQPTLVREMSAPAGRLSMMASESPRPLGPSRAPPRHGGEASGAAQTNQGRHDAYPSATMMAKVVRTHTTVVDSPTTRHSPSHLKMDVAELQRARRPNESERSSTSSIDGLLGPPGLRRKRSSSLHSISDLLGDQSFRIHNIATTTTDPAVATSSRASVRHSTSDQGSLVGERKLSKASSYASSSEASSNGQQIVPTVNATSGAPPRVRRNSKGGGNVVQINGIALGVGKFINVGNVPGVIRYIGPTMFAPGQWIGIELVEKKGKHNGTVQNVQYFECTPDHGIFIRAERLDIST